MFTIFWVTNKGIIYFDENWQQTSNIEDCILFKSKEKAKSEHVKRFGFNPNIISVENKLLTDKAK